MGWTAWPLPVFWAQAAGSAASNPTALAPLALRRWFGSLTLSSPESVPSLFGLWTWLLGLLGLFALVAVFQGPGRALRQVLDLPGNLRLATEATRRLCRAGRMLSAVIGLTVLSWTGSQCLTYSRPEGRDDLILLTKARGLGELAFEQGVLAALTPLRDVAGLGSNLPMLAVAVVLIFRASVESWGSSPAFRRVDRKRVSGWTHFTWLSGVLLIIYRLISLGSNSTEIPLGGCLMVESLLVPAIMALCDGLLFGWVLVELRQAGLDDAGEGSLDVLNATDLMPASILAVLLTLPARYLATAVLLALVYLPASAGTTALGGLLRWQLGWGLSEVQGGALAFVGLAGAVAWGTGGLGGAFRGYARLLAAEGGRVWAVLALAGLAAGTGASAAYLAVLSLPSATWVLSAADGYAHYATLPVGLWAASALVELGERSLPEATFAPDVGLRQGD